MGIPLLLRTQVRRPVRMMNGDMRAICSDDLLPRRTIGDRKYTDRLQIRGPRLIGLLSGRPPGRACALIAQPLFLDQPFGQMKIGGAPHAEFGCMCAREPAHAIEDLTKGHGCMYSAGTGGGPLVHGTGRRWQHARLRLAVGLAEQGEFPALQPLPTAHQPPHIILELSRSAIVLSLGS